MLDREEFARWQQASSDGLRGARVQRDADLHQWACFLAEQAAQLTVKALLHGVGGEAWGHDLVRLGEAVGVALATELPAELQAALRRLSRHYIPARYPDAHPAGSPGSHYGPEDADTALADAELVAASVLEWWRQLVSAEDESGR